MLEIKVYVTAPGLLYFLKKEEKCLYNLMDTLSARLLESRIAGMAVTYELLIYSLSSFSFLLNLYISEIGKIRLQYFLSIR